MNLLHTINQFINDNGGSESLLNDVVSEAYQSDEIIQSKPLRKYKPRHVPYNPVIGHEYNLILNTETGIYYGSARAAALSTSLPLRTVQHWIDGTRQNNKTSFIIVMDNQKSIASVAKQPKRGTPYFYAEKGVPVWLYKFKSETEYLVCDDQKFSITANYFEVSPESLMPTHKKRSSINTIRKADYKHTQAEKKSLNTFFDQQALKIPFNCMNCGKPLYANNKFAKRCVTAHILPKSKFASVATHTDNVVFMGVDLLGICNCHTEYDEKGILNRTKMPIYSVAIERFENSLKQHLTQKELIEAYTYLNIKWQ